tara:strand:+ start:8125 stop:8976 length:852 start_codon:yes stop_codon:yes gene_type:complete
MALESATYVSGLVQANPPGTDVISQGDDHLRLIKKVLLNSFPNADAAINGIHVKATAPSSTTAGLLWFDSTNNVLKLRDETDSSWVALAISPVTDYKILGSPTVGWTLPSTDGSSGQALTTNASGALVFGSAGKVTSVTHAIQSATGSIRDTSYYETGFTITHSKLSATSTLYLQLDLQQQSFCNFDSTTVQYNYIQLTNTSGTIIANTTADIQIAAMEDVGRGSSVSWDWSSNFSRMFKIANADCPTPGIASQVFKVYLKMTSSEDGGCSFPNGTMTVWEVE